MSSKDHMYMGAAAHRLHQRPAWLHSSPRPSSQQERHSRQYTGARQGGFHGSRPAALLQQLWLGGTWCLEPLQNLCSGWTDQLMSSCHGKQVRHGTSQVSNKVQLLAGGCLSSCRLTTQEVCCIR